jgi:hypothetical protein
MYENPNKKDPGSLQRLLELSPLDDFSILKYNTVFVP